jgi:hypothetical protein
MIASAISTRRHRAVESFGSAADCIGKIEKNMSLFAITRGQFSMLDIVSVLISQAGPCKLSVWTWAIADYEVECFNNFMQNKMILEADLIVDRAAENKNAEIIQEWRNHFGRNSVKVCKNHAKIATIENAYYKLLARGSMNLNFNPRFEQFDITEGGADFDLVKKIESEFEVLLPKCTNFDAMNNSQLGLAFDAKDLKMFDGVKVWNK